MDFWARFVLASLAVWRLSHLLTLEDGPFDLIVRLRMRLGDAGRALDCFYCMSLWVAAPLALFVDTVMQNWWCIWLALSGAAGVLHRVGQHAVPASTQGDGDGLLRAEAGSVGEPSGSGALEAAGRLDRSADGYQRTEP